MIDSNSKKLLVIGGVAAGTKAAARARRANPDWDVTLITRDSDISYAGCGLPYFISRIIKERRELVVKTPEEFEGDTGVRVLTRHEALSVNPQNRRVRVRNLEAGEERDFSYDHLIFATGASPVLPPVPGIDSGRVFALRTVRDAVQIRETIESGSVKNAVVVGGGFIGLEAAENLHLAGVHTTLIEMACQVLPGFEPELALLAGKYVAENGVDIRCSEKVLRMESDAQGNVSGIVTDRAQYPADLVIWATGVRPNVELARQCGVQIGPSGAIRVNNRMETNIPGVFAVGDCAETVHQLTGAPAWSPMGSTANKAGRVAGAQAVGYPSCGQFSGVMGTTVIKLFGMNLAKTGLTTEEAQRCGFRPVSSLVPANDRAHYFPGHRQITIKLVVDADTRRVLGAQVIGEGVVDKPIDTLATLITMGGKVDDLAILDLAYAPPFSTAISPVILAAHVVMNKLDGRLRGVSSIELHDMLGDRGVQLVDVRTEPEFMIGAIPGAANIPFAELEERAAELDSSRPVVLVCKVGKRAYMASGVLARKGFSDVAILDGGIASYPFEIE